VPGPLAGLTRTPDDGPGAPLGLACGPSGLAVVQPDGGSQVVPLAQAPALLVRLERERRPRWVWWSARSVVAPLLVVDPSLRLARCWDLAAAHRLLHGGSADAPDAVWCAVRGLPAGATPRTGQMDLLGGDSASWGLQAGAAGDDDGDPDEPVRPDGYLRPDWVGGAWAASPQRLVRWAALALEVAAHQREEVRRTPSRGDAVHCAHAESAAELFAVELAATGLPVDRGVAEGLVAAVAGRRPTDEADERALRGVRDRVVLDTVPTSGHVDLRSPAQVKDLLQRNGFDLPDTRSWRLEPMAGTHPLVDALLAWRKAERIATTYGYRWLDQHLGADGRLRGGWTGSDGGAGRMTAQAGLHSMPRELRVAVVAEPGHVFVRADLGQVEPRVLAAISGDRSLSRAAAADDMYADVALALGCDRPVAKIAVLAAMYGQTSGTAADALRDMERAYPTAMRFLQDAHDQGRAGRDVLTWGGRRVRMWRAPELDPDADAAAVRAHRSVLAARGRFARNAVVQGSAAELFKAWTATVRARLVASSAGEVVLCLHDELLLHVREEAAEQVARDVVTDLEATAGRWSPSGVRFVADVTVVRRWSDAKG
jgi:DNA polymerase-1